METLFNHFVGTLPFPRPGPPMARVFILCLLTITYPAFAWQGDNQYTTQNSTDANVINWHVSHKPPSMFLHGPHQNNGFIDKILSLIEAQLTHYQHQRVQASFSRTIRDLKAQDQVCYPALVRNKAREKYIAFSQMSVMHPSNYVTLPMALVQKMQIRKKADLRELLDDNALVLGLESGRSYGRQIDSTIRIHGVNTTMTFKAGKSLVDLYRMLTRQRVDYLIGYPFEAYFALETLEKSDIFRSFPILGTPQFTMGAVGCTNTPWGREVIAQVNQALDGLKPTPDYQQALTSWLQDFVVNERFAHYYQNTFLNN